MIADKVIGNIKSYTSQKEKITVALEWFEAEKTRIKKAAADGEEIGICISEPLCDGDIIAESDTKVYYIEIIPTRLVKINVSKMTEMGRLCFELGNRHLSLKITEDTVYIPYDEPTFLYLKKLGFNAQEVNEKFSGFIQCKAHGASHSHSHEHTHEHSENHSHENNHKHHHE